MKFLVALCGALGAGLSLVGAAAAQQLPCIIDADADALILVDPSTGDRTVISGCADAGCTSIVGTGTNFQFGRGIYFEPDGNILVGDGDLNDLNNQPIIFRVDPGTGDRTVVSSSVSGSEVGTGPAFDTLFDVILLANGDILASDTVIDTIFRVDPISGDRTVVASNSVGTGPTFTFPGDLVLEAGGTVLTTEGGNDQVLRIDTANGNRTLVSGCSNPPTCNTFVGTGINLANLGGIALEADGGILVADQGASAVIAIDPITGDRTEVSGPLVGTGPAFVDTFSIDINMAGNIYIADGVVGLIRVDRATGDRVVVSSGTVGTGIPISLLRDVRMQPLPQAQVPLSSPFTVVVIAMLVMGTAATWLSRRVKTQV